MIDPPEDVAIRMACLNQAKKILLEQYAAFVIVARHTDENDAHCIDYLSNANRAESIGLTELSRARMLEEDRLRQVDPS